MVDDGMAEGYKEFVKEYGLRENWRIETGTIDKEEIMVNHCDADEIEKIRCGLLTQGLYPLLFDFNPIP
ncbi:hypothetical protein C1646_750332 [Rhizophagus diaphanus]|nr:hypothetical protein C1646_750332 [Rhizophagus diaphanus] [Rhizophagus sp. MUCL 43196]